ncbi:MAG: VIT domain-containing protein, partial [bacterium]
MYKPILIFLALLLGLIGVPAAQTIPPLLVVKGVGGTQSTRLRVSSVTVETRIFGSLAQTRMTLVFYNPSARRLAGDLYFPLPPGATISGYALDVGGVLRDAVVVEKDKGRQVFEKIVRQGLDPGLVEWTKGNTFKTRIFPIPPRGSRTVRISYVSDLLQAKGEQQYRLPLNFKEKIEAFSIRIEVVKSTARPKVRGPSPPGFEFTPWRDSFVAEARGKNADLSRPLTVVLPAVKRQPVVVEKRAGEPSYFLINTSPPPPKLSAARTPRHITLYWDASASRENSSHQLALGLLKAFFRKHQSKGLRVDLVVFRDAPEKARTFRVSGGNPGTSRLFAAVKALPYDGGTQLGALPPPAAGSEYSLLFSDGLSTFGKERPEAFAKPVYVFSSETAANQPLLRLIATESGGQFFDLNRTEQSAILARIGPPVFGFLGAKVVSGRVREAYPNTPVPVSGPFTYAGKLMTRKAVVELRFGAGGRVTHRKRYTLSRADAGEGGLVRLAWAQKKLDALLVMPKRNRAEMIELGREYGLVTPGTSLIVLETFDQYVEHRIEPPGSLPQWRDRFLKIIARQRRKESNNTEAKLARVIRLWKKQVAWWETEFDYPPDFRYRKTVKKSRSRPSRRLGDIAAGNGAPRLQPMRRPPPSAPPPPSATAMEADGGGGLRTGASGRVSAEKAKKPGSVAPPRGPVVSIKPWDPKTPYLAALRKTKPGAKYEVYLEQRKQFGTSPAFYLDSGDHFQKSGLPGLALRIWSNLAEMELENPALLRILAHRLGQANWLELSALTFEEILRLRPEEPQSFRDLALVAGRLKNYPRAIDLLNKVVLGNWDRRFPEIELIALMELNELIAKAKAVGIKGFPVDPRLVKLLDVDVRI